MTTTTINYRETTGLYVRVGVLADSEGSAVALAEENENKSAAWVDTTTDGYEVVFETE